MSIADDIKAKVTPWLTQVATEGAEAAGAARKAEIERAGESEGERTAKPRIIAALAFGAGGLLFGILGSIVTARRRA